MSYPPPPQYGTGRYSPGRPAYSDRPPFPPTLPAPVSRDYPAYSYPSPAPAPPPAAYRPFDPYSTDTRPPAAYPQPRDPYAPDSYDPYSPATAYHPSSAMNFPSASSPPAPAPRHEPSPLPPRPIARPASPPKRVAQSAPRADPGNDLPMLTAPITANISGITTAIYSLPPSHLPLVKYIAVNPGDCVDIHRALCIKSKAVWYADGCSRAGEGWAAAIEWIIDAGQSGRKMRACIPGADGLECELGAICKAVEGFYELLQLSIKEGTPMSHELIVFCDSAAALVAIDTGSRPESLRFDQLWRAVCSEFLQAHLTFVWLPKNSGIEGHVLSDKIAVVAASNSFLKKKKEGTLPDPFRRPGGGDALPSGSAEPGPWQRGDADPSRRKEYFDRPKPPPLSPQKAQEVKLESGQTEGEEYENGEVQQQQPGFGDADGQSPPPREAIFVTSFPDSLSAKDLGVLYAQFGELTSVDIYHTDPAHPRFAYVQYTTIESGNAAIAALNARPIDFANAYARENAADLADWQGWQGHMKVVRNDPGRFIPSSVVNLFPGIAGWMTGTDGNLAVAAAGGVAEDAGSEVKVEKEDEEKNRKRDRSADQQANGAAQQSTASSIVDCPSPHKRPRQEPPVAPTTTAPAPALGLAGLPSKPVDFAAQLSDLVTKASEPTCALPQAPVAAAPAASQAVRSNGNSQFTPPPNLPPFPPSYNRNDLPDRPALLAPAFTHPIGTPQAHHVLPPTPQTAERPRPASLPAKPPSPISMQVPEHVSTPLTAAAAPMAYAPATAPALAPVTTAPSLAPAPAPAPATTGPPAQAQPSATAGSSSTRPPLTNSAAEPQEYPIQLSTKTLESQLALVKHTFVKHDRNNWIAHACLVAVDLDQARKALQTDLFLTDEGFLTGRDLEQELIKRGYTAPRVDAFITKVLKVLDGIALAEALETGDAPEGPGAGAAGGSADATHRQALSAELERELEKYPDQTKEAVRSAGITVEYLYRGKILQEKKRLDVERRVKVLEGMVKIGEVVSGVVRFLLTEGTG